MEPTFFIGATLLVIVAVASVVILTIVYKNLLRCYDEISRLENLVSTYFGMLSQVGDMLLEDSGVTTSHGAPLKVHSHVSFVSGALRKEGDIIFNINEKGQISRTVPICIKTKDNEKFMPSLVNDIRRMKRKKNG